MLCFNALKKQAIAANKEPSTLRCSFRASVAVAMADIHVSLKIAKDWAVGVALKKRSAAAVVLSINVLTAALADVWFFNLFACFARMGSNRCRKVSFCSSRLRHAQAIVCGTL